MQIGKLTITAPGLRAIECQESEVFGQVVSLWTKAKAQSFVPLHGVTSMLVPALKHRQYIMASAQIDRELKPVAYMAWANLSAEAEARYLRDPNIAIKPADWKSGDRMWIIDWFTPYGHAHAMRFAVGHLLAHRTARAIYHKSSLHSQHVLQLRGNEVSRWQAGRWWADRPLPPLRSSASRRVQRNG